jgi:hypothetical protein
MTASNVTGLEAPGGFRSAGTDSTAQASDAHEARMARFSEGPAVLTIEVVHAGTN